jgi:hypothetical protein
MPRPEQWRASAHAQQALEHSDPGVEGNARITGALGAVIFSLLFIEGITVLRVNDLLTLHVVVGMLLVAFVTVKIGSTGYRFVRYYTGEASYTAKGPPHVLLRVLGPVVVITTVALLGTGIAAALGGRQTEWLLPAHKASFILWFGAMTVHVLGHALQTPALAVADLRRHGRVRVPGAARRLWLLTGTTLFAVLLAVMGIGLAHRWQTERPRKPERSAAVRAVSSLSPPGAPALRPPDSRRWR